MSVATVLGEVSKDELGVTLTHEHLSINFDQFYVPPPEKLKGFFEGDITLKTAGFVKQYPYSSKTNVQLKGSEVELSISQEMDFFKNSGGCTIVENTSHGLGRNLNFMKKVSNTSGINIIAGTGHYVANVQSQSNLNQTTEHLYDLMKREMQIGCDDDNSIKCGFIGEVGSVWPIHDFEKRCIQATGQVQEELNCGVSFHPGRDVSAPEEILRLYCEAGGKVEKAVMSHLDRTLITNEQLLEFASLGSFCQFDLFGTECSFYQLNVTTDMLSDAQRIDKIICLVNDGKTNKVTVSHDIHTKHRLVNFGGHGYSHIVNNVVPKMLIKGMSNETVETILIKNPANWLCN